MRILMRRIIFWKVIQQEVKIETEDAPDENKFEKHREVLDFFK